MAVTSPTPWAGCTALSPTWNAGAGGRGSWGARKGGAPGRTEARVGPGGAEGGSVEGRSPRSGGLDGRFMLGFAAGLEETASREGARARAAEPVGVRVIGLGGRRPAGAATIR